MQYLMICNTPDIADVYTTATGFVKCLGTLEVIEYNSGIGQMTLMEIDQILGPVIFMIFFAWSAGLLVSFLKHRYF